MKALYLTILFLFSCSQLDFPWEKITFSDAQTMAIHSNKIIMIDFYADW